MRYEAANGRRVTESALITRINKKLTDDSQDRKELQMSESPSIGNFYEHANELAGRKDTIDLESIGHELGVLANDEIVVRCDAA
jgi:hypothetical protein